MKTLRYYRAMLEKYDVTVKLGQRVDADQLSEAGFDHVVVANRYQSPRAANPRHRARKSGGVYRRDQGVTSPSVKGSP